MRALFLDTSSNYLSLAVYEEDKLLHSSTTLLHNRFNEELLDYLDFVLKKINISINDIEVFYVVSGPGSFTGIRIGVSTLLGLALSQDKSLYGITSLDSAALVINKFYLKEKFTVKYKLKLNEYAVRSYDFSKMNFSEYLVKDIKEISEDAINLSDLEIPLTYSIMNKNFEQFKVSYSPFYMRKSQAEINFDKASNA